jgi:hypothetical protein
MADPLTNTLRLTQPTVGGDSGAWGSLLNSDMAYIDVGVNGILSIAVAGSTLSLEAAGDSGDQARYQWYNFTGTPGAASTITLPSNQKVGIVSNSTTGGFKLTLTTGSGGTLVVQNGQTLAFYCDGTNVGLLPWGNPGVLGAISVSGVTTLNYLESGSFVEYTGGPYTVTLPTPVGNAGLWFTQHLPTTLTGAITFSTPSGVFSGRNAAAASTVVYTITTATGPLDITMVSDGTNWVTFGGLAGPASFTTLSASGASALQGVTATTVAATTLSATGASNLQGVTATTLAASANEALNYINGSSQTIPNSSPTTLTGWSKEWDRLSANFNAATGIYTAPVSGYYLISVQSAAATGIYTSGGTWETYLITSNGAQYAGVFAMFNNTSEITPSSTTTQLVYLPAGATAKVEVYQYTGGGSVALNATSGFTSFSVAQIP